MSAPIEQRQDYPSVACSDSSPDKGSQEVPVHRSCEGCQYDLGGGRDNCLLCVAHECRDGGGFEAYKAKEREEPKQIINKELVMSLNEIFTDEVLKATIALDVSKTLVCQDWRAGIYYMRTLDELSAQIASVTDADYSKQLTEMLDAKKHCYGLDEQAWLMQKALELLAAGASRKDVMEYMEYKAYEAHLRGR